MVYKYIGYNDDKKVVRGTISAQNQETAGRILARSGYRILELKPVTSFVPSLEQSFPSLYHVKPEAIIMLSRQLALLLESGINIVTSLELLKEQSSNKALSKVLGEVVSDLRSGMRLSAALDKHPKVFPSIYRRSLSVGEQTGGLETILRQVADYMEREIITAKSIKSALRYPAIVSVVAILVIGVLVTFVLPAFIDLYAKLGAELPPMTKYLITMIDILRTNGLYIIAALVIIVCFSLTYIKTPSGMYNWHNFLLKMPLLGRVIHLNELARCCRSMSLLFKAGLPLPEIMSLATQSSNNKVISQALNNVRQDMIKGEGLSSPMSKNELFFPMMVQMARVGEETGNLDATLLSVAQTYETEAEDKTKALVGLIQPVVTLVIGLVVAFIALSLLSTMYSVYGAAI